MFVCMCKRALCHLSAARSFYQGKVRIAKLMAEEVGFEPTVGLHPRQFSRLEQSTTLPPFQTKIILSTAQCIREAKNFISSPQIQQICPSPVPLKTNFTAGEVSPRLLGRGDLRAYDNGASTLEKRVYFPPPAALPAARAPPILILPRAMGV